jgi:flagellar biosynthesis protein FlhF
VKLFTAGTIQEAMTQVKSEMGREAVILHTRRLKKGGVLGFFAKEAVEVMAGLDTPALAAVSEKRVQPIIKTNDGDTKVTALQLELSNMRKTLEQVVQKMPTELGRTSPLLEILIKNDVDRQIAENLIKGLPDNISELDYNTNLAKQMLAERIANYFQRIDGIAIPPRGTKTVALIGPTGVGKTTTLAKLAANFVIKKGCKVALVTADTYRISAVEQLKTYADIIGVPIEVVYSPDELKAALYRHQDKELVLVDTAGRSPSNQYQLAELQALLEIDPYIETHLVMSATTKYRDALEIVNKFSICSPQKFLFTKVDEASNLGTIFNLLYQFPATLSYITTGQNVPDDISLVNPNELAELMMRE